MRGAPPPDTFSLAMYPHHETAITHVTGRLRADPSIRAVDRKAERIARFLAQLEAWHWYAHEALRRDDRYLLGTATARFVVFAGRLLLARNERLYPYHEWLLRVLEDLPDRPPDRLERIAAVYDAPSQASLLALWACVRSFRAWEGADRSSARQLEKHSELDWRVREPPIEDP